MMGSLVLIPAFCCWCWHRHILSLCSAAAADDGGGGDDEASWAKGLTRLQACSLNVVEEVLILP